MGSVTRKCDIVFIHLAFKVLLLFLISNIFTQLLSNAQLLPPDEVKTLQIISDKLENRYWKRINPTSCNDGGQTFNKSFIYNIYSNVTCDCSFNQGTICHVTHILMKGLNLSGVLPAEFGNLTQLEEINLSRNYISGPIPPGLSKIPLLILALVGNRITGRIPDEIGQIASLQELVVEDNKLEGTLPPSLGNLNNLSRLVLSGNYFNGPIPETYGNMKNLTEVRLNGNVLSGKMPDFIGNWTKLLIFDIQGTAMEGPIPSSLTLLTNLTILRISDLNAKGMPLPNLVVLTKLLELVLRNCSITDDQIINYMGNFPNLTHLDLSYNQLNGIIPNSMQNLQSLHYLILTNNSLSGRLPNWILNNNNQHFDVSYNNFTGSLPTFSCQQSNLNLVSSYSSEKDNPDGWCLKKDLPCSSSSQYHSLFINCGGGGSQMEFEGNNYEPDNTLGGASNFISSSEEKWAYSSTGAFLYRDSAQFLAQERSNRNITGIYQTARLAPLSLKYYGLCLRSGSYNVTLHFAEIMFFNDYTFASLGRRFFDVEIQGNLVLKDFNIADSAGGVGKPYAKNFPNISVHDGTLKIYLYWSGRGTTSLPDRAAYGPLISAITVKPNFKTEEENLADFKTGTALSSAAIAGIVLASCAIIASLLVLLRMKGCLGGKDDENEAFRGLGTGYFPLRQIKTATNDFSALNHIGEGGFGPVYKGVLPDGRVIAVKKLSSKSNQGNHEFVNEIGLISALQHPNLVKLYGCCIEGKEMLLVYEYMENNSLARALFGRDNQRLNLDWPTRKKICLGIARGLAYLHEESRLKIVHRDIKATNVLLDKDLNARISDFGLAKLDEEENTHISTRIAGTIGYMAPEYAMRGYLTDKADVYSFGVVMLEIVSGKSNTNYRPKEEFVYLLDWAIVLQEQGNTLELVDPILGSNYSEEEALRFLNLALLCTSLSPTLRPKMSSVVSMIDGKLPVQALVIERPDTNLRFKAFDNLSQDSQTNVSRSSKYTRDIQRSISMDGPWMNSGISMQSYNDETQWISASSKLKPN